MHTSTTIRLLSLASALIAGVLATSGAKAVEEQSNLGQVIYTTGTAPVQSVREVTLIAPQPAAAANGASWRVASLDTGMLLSQGSTISIQSTGFTGISPIRGQSEGLVANEPSKAREPAGEPGFWSAALATLGLAVFFFLRRLS